MQRYLQKEIIKSLNDKIVLLTGPRQSGKTTLAKQLFTQFDYFNYDADEDRLALRHKSWDRKKPVIIFDELHKMRNWKRWLKGVYDKEGNTPHLLVTGSAKIDTYRKVGDSLAGRYFQYRLHPLDIKEIVRHNPTLSPNAVCDQLLNCSGFPEPFLKGSEQYYRRWRRGHLDIILRQDLIDQYAVRDIRSIETLVHLLKSRVGSGISYANLARDLERDTNTIKRWLQMLENLYIVFRITPWHQQISRSLLREPKFYFFDLARAENEGARIENLVALTLLKELDYLEDIEGITGSLHYLRTKDGREIDFVVCIEGKPLHLIEVKTSDDNLSPAFYHFQKQLPGIRATQLVKNCTREKTFPGGAEIRELAPWLATVIFDNNPPAK